MASTPDTTYVPKIQERNNGDLLAVASGGVLDIEPGGALKINGTDMTAAIAALPPATNYAIGVAASYKVARGVVAVTNAHSGIETVVTGLTTVVAAVACMEDDPTTTCESVTCTI